MKLKLFLIIITLISISSCATKGLITEQYESDFYKVPKLLPDDLVIKNKSKFIIYSDNQSGWRIRDVFYQKSNWTSPKMLIFPFYELYLIGNGIVGGFNYLRHVPDVGKKGRLMVRDAIYTEATHSDAAFILNAGDINAYDGRRPSHWKTFLRENRFLLNEIPYLPTIGNHEYANDTTYAFPNYQAIFDMPRFYVIELEHAILIVLDSNFIIDQRQFIDDETQDQLFNQWFVSGENSSEPSWLEQQLKTYDKSSKIVVMHHPPITFGKHHKDWYNSSYGKDLTKKRLQLLKLFQQHNVQVVFSGHEHLYQHNVLNRGASKAVHFFVGGGGGTPLREFPDAKTQRQFQQNYIDEELDVISIKKKEIYHYYVVTAKRDSLEIKVIEVTDKQELPTQLIEVIEIKK